MEERIDVLEHMQQLVSPVVSGVSYGKIDLDLNFMLRYLASKVEEQLEFFLEVSNELADDFDMDPSTGLEMFSFLWRTCVLMLKYGQVNKAALDVTADLDHIYLELVFFDADWKKSQLYAFNKQLELADAEVDIAWMGDQCHVTAMFAL
jgi:hypothetical protein